MPFLLIYVNGGIPYVWYAGWGNFNKCPGKGKCIAAGKTDGSYIYKKGVEVRYIIAPPPHISKKRILYKKLY